MKNLTLTFRNSRLNAWISLSSFYGNGKSISNVTPPPV